MAAKATGIVYDERMKEHVPSDSMHPETPKRIEAIWKALDEAGYVQRCSRVESRQATDDELRLVHGEDEIALVKSNGERQDLVHQRQNSLYFSKGTYISASVAAGSVIELTQQVCNGRVLNGLAVVRPPGHHAEHTHPEGFCFYNSVALAAKVALKCPNINKVLIVDWDVHHGNGIQTTFYDDPNVLYCSLHRYDNGCFYPGLPGANYDHTGVDKGEGFNMNIAWNNHPMGDGDYLTAFQQLLMPVAYEFNPDLVLVASGLDAAQGDPLGNYNITPEGYAHMTHQLSALAGGRLVVALEGGYNLRAISQSMCAICAVLLGDTLPRLEDYIVSEKGACAIRNSISAIAKHWKCLQHAAVGGQTEDAKTEDTVVASADTDTTSSSTGGNVAETEEEWPPVPKPTRGVALESSANDDDPHGATGGMSAQDDVSELLKHLELEGHSKVFAVSPKASCPHLISVQSLPEGGTIDVKKPCVECRGTIENWICLECYQVYCGRYVKEHMVRHGEQTNHPMVLSFSDLSVWCYPCDSYVHNPKLFPIIDAAHISKFGRHARLI